MSTDDLTWEPPGPGQWYASPEHMPTPVTRLFAELFGQVAVGWARGADRYGLPPNHGTFGAVNCWFYYSPGTPKPVDVDRLDAHAAETLATRRWRGDLVHWHEVLRPATVATSRALLAEDLTVLSDAELADHVERTIEHFLVHGPQHFEAVHGDAAAGALLHAARDWDLDPRQLVEALAGQADASTSAERLFDRIAEGLRAAGTHQLDDLDDVRARRRRCGPRAGRAVRGLRVAGLRQRPHRAHARRAPGRHRAGDPGRAGGSIGAPPADRGGPRTDARARAGGRPRSLRRAGRRRPRGLRGQRRQHDGALRPAVGPGASRRARGGPAAGGAGPRRRARPRPRRRARRARGAAAGRRPFTGRAGRSSGGADPGSRRWSLRPRSARRPHRWLRRRLGRTPSRWSPCSTRTGRSPGGRGDDPSRAVATVGDRVVRGRAVVATDPTDALMRIEPGDVLVVLTTTASYNTIFPRWRRWRSSTAGS